ncbi:MAG: LytR C-terminal domain-containing protein [Segniliparus sp.]|uniref:LytR C-terminal domain-containing protein n=1 Tax=Segniliparus sp. TaxID=2804064 RepID=UPI003F29F7D9
MLDRLAKWGLPLRAVAMVLFSVAVVFLLFGVRAVANNGPSVDPLQAAADKAAQAAVAASAAQQPQSAPSAEPPPGKVCVYNYSPGHKNWASSVATALKGKGLDAEVADGYALGKVDGSVVYYKDAYQNQAKKVAEASGLGPEPKAAPLPSSVDLGTECKGELALILSE